MTHYTPNERCHNAQEAEQSCVVFAASKTLYFPQLLEMASFWDSYEFSIEFKKKISGYSLSSEVPKLGVTTYQLENPCVWPLKGAGKEGSNSPQNCAVSTARFPNYLQRASASHHQDMSGELCWPKRVRIVPSVSDIWTFIF